MKLLFSSCSGGQNITIMGRNFDVIDNLIFSHEVKGNVSLQLVCNNSYLQGWFLFSSYWNICSCLVTSCVWLFAIPWTAAFPASLSFAVSWSLLKLMSIELMICWGYFWFLCFCTVMRFYLLHDITICVAMEIIRPQTWSWELWHRGKRNELEMTGAALFSC